MWIAIQIQQLTAVRCTPYFLLFTFIRFVPYYKFLLDYVYFVYDLKCHAGI
jgi:hypothetical protein